MSKNVITVETVVEAPIEKVWEYWTNPEYIKQWNNASDDWHTPYAENDPREGGKFLSRMAAKNGSFEFDFEGVYDEVQLYRSIAYTLLDGRKVRIDFTQQENKVKIVEAFEAESSHSFEMQKTGWQSILTNFKKLVEAAFNG